MTETDNAGGRHSIFGLNLKVETLPHDTKLVEVSR